MGKFDWNWKTNWNLAVADQIHAAWLIFAAGSSLENLSDDGGSLFEK